MYPIPAPHRLHSTCCCTALAYGLARPAHLLTSLKSPFSAFSMADCAIQLRSTNL